MVKVEYKDRVFVINYELIPLSAILSDSQIMAQIDEEERSALQSKELGFYNIVLSSGELGIYLPQMLLTIGDEEEEIISYFEDSDDMDELLRREELLDLEN